MARLTRPRFWLMVVNLLLILGPAGLGWADGAREGVLGTLVVDGFMLATVAVVARWVLRLAQCKQTGWRMQAAAFAVIAVGFPAAVVYPMLLVTHPGIYTAVLAFVLAQFGGGAAHRAVRRFRASREGDPA